MAVCIRPKKTAAGVPLLLNTGPKARNNVREMRFYYKIDYVLV